MMKFDPVALRARLLGDCGIEFHLGRKLEKSQAVGGLASSADAYIDEAIECLLVDFDDAAKQLLEKPGAQGRRATPSIGDASEQAAAPARRGRCSWR